MEGETKEGRGVQRRVNVGVSVRWVFTHPAVDGRRIHAPTKQGSWGKRLGGASGVRSGRFAGLVRHSGAEVGMWRRPMGQLVGDCLTFNPESAGLLKLVRRVVTKLEQKGTTCATPISIERKKQ